MQTLKDHVLTAHPLLLVDSIGKDASALKGAYAVEVCERQARRLNWRCHRSGRSLVIFHPQRGRLTVDATGQIEAHGFHGEGCHDATKLFSMQLGSVTRSARKQALSETVVQQRAKG